MTDPTTARGAGTYFVMPTDDEQRSLVVHRPTGKTVDTYQGPNHQERAEETADTLNQRRTS